MAERIAARERAFATAPADEFPWVTAAAATIASYISTEQYLWGLHRLLDGITIGSDPKSAAMASRVEWGRRVRGREVGPAAIRVGGWWVAGRGGLG